MGRTPDSAISELEYQALPPVLRRKVGNPKGPPHLSLPYLVEPSVPTRSEWLVVEAPRSRASRAATGQLGARRRPEPRPCVSAGSISLYHARSGPRPFSYRTITQSLVRLDLLLTLCVWHQFFSSLERLRLEKDGCTPCSTAPCSRRASMVGTRATSVLTEVFALSSTFRAGQHKRGLSATDRQLHHDTATWFASLPPAVRRKQFSREEQVIFASGRHCIIVDAADEVVDRHCHNRRPSAPRPGHLDRRTSRRRHQDEHFYFCFDSSDSGSDEYDSSDEKGGSCGSSRCYSRDLDDDDVDDVETVAWSVDSMDSMDSTANYSIDSFCFLDEPKLDLKLDDYHQAIRETAASKKSTLPRRRAARNLSQSSTSLRKSSLSSQTMALSNRSYTSSMLLQSPPSPPTHASRSVGPAHRARPSTASIERQAMFYQDPAARMQLRLYLASPSKFDEAVEFGFPSLHDAPEVDVPSEATGVQEADEMKGTFLNDDTPSLFNDDDEDGELADELDKWNDPTTPEDAEFRRDSTRLARLQTAGKARVVGPSYTQGRPPGREMTMHMTLTRPDLRSPEEMERLGINTRPIERAALPPYDRGESVWGPQPHEKSRMRKMWNKLRAR